MDDRNAVGKLYECQECGLRSLEFGPKADLQRTCKLCFGRFVEQSLGGKEPHQAADEVTALTILTKVDRIKLGITDWFTKLKSKLGMSKFS